MHPWGVAELRALALYDRLIRACAHQARYWITYQGSALARRRDLPETTPQGATALNFSHPEMQEVLLADAIEAGAEVRRGVMVTKVNGGGSPLVTVSVGRSADVVRGRLIVGADGRQSAARRYAGFVVNRDPKRLLICGALFEGLGAPDDAVHVFVARDYGHASLLFPIGRDRFRLYFTTGRRSEHRALSGTRDLSEFYNYCSGTGVPREWFARANLVGPLASFEGADTWVNHPCKDGVVLVGDAAAANDPCFGCGLSLTLRDVRVLRDLLLTSDDWEQACHRYAAEHDRYYESLHTITSWLREVRYGFGPHADRARQHALPKLASGTGPDLVGLGPDCIADADARRQFLGS